MALIKCKECGNEISTKAEACPKCGAKIKSSGFGTRILKGIAIFFLGSFILGIFASISNSVNGTPGAQNQAIGIPDPSSEDFTVSNLHIKNDGIGNGVIAGTITNNTSKSFSYAQVEINLYDKSGAQVGSTLANVNNIEPNGKWKFEAPVFQDNAASYKVAAVHGF